MAGNPGQALTPADFADKKNYAFIADGFETDAYYQELQEYSCHLVDVKGDGNCGYYAIFLGLCNVHKKALSTLKGNNWRNYLVTF